MPLVTVIIPTYNRAKMITKTLDSIIAQTYQNFEVIVVDDGSTDDTIQILNEYKQSITRNDIVFKILQQENAGAPAARNHGLKNASGEYLVFFDSDDRMLPERIEKQVQKMIEEQSDCCACGYIKDSKQQDYNPHIIHGKSVLYSFLKNKIFGSTQCWMLKNSLVLKVGGYDEALVCRQDMDLTFRILKQQPQISIVAQTLSVFIDHDDTGRIMNKIRNNPNAYTSIVRYHSKVVDYCVLNKELKLLFIEMRKYTGDIVSFFLPKTYRDLWKEIISITKIFYKYSFFNRIFPIILGLVCLHYYYFKIKYFKY
jgi:glycosyltransferase involved in cell wall biosynthesis